MFFRLYKYALLRSMRQKLNVFWNLIFPVILGTLFQLAFGNFLEQEVIFHPIPIAYVEGAQADESFTEVLGTLETDSSLIQVRTADMEEAKTLLKDGEVKGIFCNGAQEADSNSQPVHLIVSGQGIDQSILNAILEQYAHTIRIFTQIGKTHPERIQAAASVLERECQYLKEGKISGQPVVNTLDYFYSLLAMNCLMGATTGLMCAIRFKADLSSLAARRVVASTNRFCVLMADLAANITLQFFYLVFSASYLMFALKVPMGNQWGWMLLTLFLGCVLGITIGFFIGVVGKQQENTKEGICITVMMISSFFSGLMIADMRRLVESYAPWFAGINPASLITKAFYSLNVYETYTRYAQSMGMLLLLSILFGAGALAIVRRERCASI